MRLFNIKLKCSSNIFPVEVLPVCAEIFAVAPLQSALLSKIRPTCHHDRSHKKQRKNALEFLDSKAFCTGAVVIQACFRSRKQAGEAAPCASSPSSRPYRRSKKQCRDAALFFASGAGGFEPATHGFGAALVKFYWLELYQRLQGF